MHWFYDPTFTGDSSSIRVDEIQHFKSLRIRGGEQIVVTDGLGNSHKCEAIEPAKGLVRVASSTRHNRPEGSGALAANCHSGNETKSAGLPARNSRPA